MMEENILLITDPETNTVYTVQLNNEDIVRAQTGKRILVKTRNLFNLHLLYLDQINNLVVVYYSTPKPKLIHVGRKKPLKLLIVLQNHKKIMKHAIMMTPPFKSHFGGMIRM